MSFQGSIAKIACALSIKQQPALTAIEMIVFLSALHVCALNDFIAGRSQASQVVGLDRPSEKPQHVLNV